MDNSRPQLSVVVVVIGIPLGKFDQRIGRFPSIGLSGLSWMSSQVEQSSTPRSSHRLFNRLFKLPQENSGSYLSRRVFADKDAKGGIAFDLGYSNSANESFGEVSPLSGIHTAFGNECGGEAPRI